MTLSDPEKNKLNNALLREKERLQKSLAEFADRDPKDSLNWTARFPEFSDAGARKNDLGGENADEVEEYETRLETEDALEDRLRDIARALDKFDSGTFGICEKCREPIPIARLSANPAARFDIEHES